MEWPRTAVTRFKISAPVTLHWPSTYQGVEIKMLWVVFSCHWKFNFFQWQRIGTVAQHRQAGYALPLEPMLSFWPILRHSEIAPVIQNESSGGLTAQKSWQFHSMLVKTVKWKRIRLDKCWHKQCTIALDPFCVVPVSFGISQNSYNWLKSSGLSGNWLVYDSS